MLIIDEMGHRHVKRVDGDDTRVSQHQIRLVRAGARRGLERLHPLRETYWKACTWRENQGENRNGEVCTRTGDYKEGATGEEKRTNGRACCWSWS